METKLQKNWWRSAVVYQIYPRSFCDSNGDGIGDIPGIVSKLPYLKELGVDVIWLSPVYASPNCDNGYDISDYRAIHPDFGTMEDMDQLIREAERMGIRILMDLVINHTSDRHEWFQKALANDPVYRDYYIFREGKADGSLPNNWGSFFAGDVWESAGDGTYYLHLFAPGQPDLNWHNPRVYEEVCDILRFWLDKGIAGFRCDVINVLYKNTLEDGKKQLALTGKEHYLSTDGTHDILQRLRRDVFSKYDCFTVGETVLVDTKTAMKLCGSNRGELDMVFGFEHMEADQIGVKWFKTPYHPKRLIDALDRWQREMEWNANYLENHDQPRSVSRFGDVCGYHKESAKMLCGLNLSLRGTPYIYEGEEIGMTNGDFSGLSEIQDVESHNVYKMMCDLHFPASVRDKLLLQTTRDNARTPMQWTDEKYAGFSEGEPWLKVNANHTWINVETQERDPDSILAFYRKMIAFRKNSDALKWGDYRKFPSVSGVYVFRRRTRLECLVIYANLTPHRKKAPIFLGTCLFGNYPEEGREEGWLRPYEFRILQK